MIKKIRAMIQSDITGVSRVHSEIFSRQQASTKWVTCNFNAYPRVLCFVAENEDGQIIGYIQWLQRSGFRKAAVIELEQIAVLTAYQGQGVGARLITESLDMVKAYLSEVDVSLKSIMVSTREDNVAQALYRKVLGVETCAVVSDLYSGG